MDENRCYYKHNTYTNASDDSSCTFPLPWLTDTRRRKSRLGNHGRHTRVLQEINNQNVNSNTEEVDENHDPLKASNQDSISFDCIKPTDTDSDSHDVGFMKSNDVLDSGFIKFTTNSGDINFSHLDTADLMDISISKADTNHDMELIEVSRFSSPDDVHQPKHNVYSPLETNLKSSDHSSFENEILNMHSKSYSPEFIPQGFPRSTKSVDVLSSRPTSDYGSLLDDVSIESNQTPLAMDLIVKNNNYTSPKENIPSVEHRTPLPASYVLKTNSNESSKENIPSPATDEMVSRSKSNYSPYQENIPTEVHRSNDFVSKKNDFSSPKENILTDPHLSLFSIDFISKKSFSSPKDNILGDPNVQSIPVDFAAKKSDYSSPLEHVQVNSTPSSFLVDYATKQNENSSPREDTPMDFTSKKIDYSSSKENIAPGSYRSSFPAADLLPKTNLPPLKNERIELPQRTPFSTEPLQKANQVSPKRNEISNPISELFSKPNQVFPAKPFENHAREFKQPEAIVLPPPAPKKGEFQFEAPLPPSNPLPLLSSKNNKKLPAFITVKGKSYSVLNVLGSGGSSLVYQVLHPEHGEMLAIKQVKLSEVDERIAEGYIDEVNTLKKLQKCGSIIKMYDYEIIYDNSKKLLNVVMEKGDTDLAELLKNKNKKPTMYMIVYYWTEMLSAVLEIHNEKIIHSDLKPANFLIVKGSLKLIDFGIASSVQSDMTSVYKDVFTGTLNYMSPEAVQCVNSPSGAFGYKITYKTDVWSLGCILYHLIYGRLPFQHLKRKWEKLQAIGEPNLKIEFPEVKGVPAVLMSALKSCLEIDPKKRMSVDELLQLPYFGN